MRQRFCLTFVALDSDDPFVTVRSRLATSRGSKGSVQLRPSQLEPSSSHIAESPTLGGPLKKDILRMSSRTSLNLPPIVPPSSSQSLTCTQQCFCRLCHLLLPSPVLHQIMSHSSSSSKILALKFSSLREETLNNFVCGYVVVQKRSILAIPALFLMLTNNTEINCLYKTLKATLKPRQLPRGRLFFKENHLVLFLVGHYYCLSPTRLALRELHFTNTCENWYVGSQLRHK